MFHFIFDYDYGNFWSILKIFVPLETGMNTLPNVYKLSLQPNYVSTLPGKTKNNTKTAARLLQHSIEPIVTKFYRKLFNVRFFPYLLEHPFSSIQTKNLLHFRWFYQKFIFKLNMVNFNM